jgi:phosphoserine / homoserine phosphotransferase
MLLYCTDLEGVLTPEIWIQFAEKTGIEALRFTTRDIADYNVLMKHRLEILQKEGLKLSDIQAVISTMEPLEGATAYIEWLRERLQVVVVSDTFQQFAGPLMKKLGYPLLICHELEVDDRGVITGYKLRQEGGKRKTVEAFKGLNYKVLASGDSYNDIQMLQAADRGVLFRPPMNVIQEFPQFPVTHSYDELKAIIDESIARFN